MSFLSFLSSHRLHATQRPWIDPLPVQLDLMLHELPRGESEDISPVENSLVSPEEREFIAPAPPPAV